MFFKKILSRLILAWVLFISGERLLAQPPALTPAMILRGDEGINLLDSFSHRDYLFAKIEILQQAEDLPPFYLLAWQGDRQVFFIEGFHPDFLNWEKVPVRKGEKQSLADLDGDGSLNAVAFSYTGGSHCCSYYNVFALGDSLRHIELLGGGDCGFSWEYLNADAYPEWVSCDNCFAYWNQSFASSPLPTVVFQLQKGKFKLQTALAAKPFSRGEYQQALAEAQEELKRFFDAPQVKDMIEQGEDPNQYGDLFSYPFWELPLELVFAGQSKRAFSFLEKTFPARYKPYQDAFIRDFAAQLQKCQYLVPDAYLRKKWRKLLPPLQKTGF